MSPKVDIWHWDRLDVDTETDFGSDSDTGFGAHNENECGIDICSEAHRLQKWF